jgi:hypothetical protein
MMRHEPTHRRLFARQTTFIQRIDAYANDCLKPVTVSTAAERGGQRSLHSGHSPSQALKARAFGPIHAWCNKASQEHP